MLSLKRITRQQVHWAYVRRQIDNGKHTPETALITEAIARAMRGEEDE